MKLSRSKVPYSIVYGISPYFKNILKGLVKQCDFVVFGFNESFNRVAQKQQMNVSFRFWNTLKNQVDTRYLTSVFLNHCTASDLLNGLKTVLENFDMMKILQISMDGPNVN